ncbi:hypothetical protein HHX47_DHR4000208 [Lentinula edodes]|nr:hypothetical protein HHX47_DHR4000208 [Lentinula edodes]
MVGKTQSQAHKAQLNREKKAERLTQAVAAYKAQLQLPKSERMSLLGISNQFDVDKMAILRKADRKTTIQEFNYTKQLLSPTEEKVLADWILCSAERGLPPTHVQIKSYADAILQKNHGPGYTEPLDSQRAQRLNPTAVESWFELVREEISDAEVEPKDAYGMDESSAPRGNLAKERVAGAQGTKTQHRQGGANRENITAIVTICADGTTLRPTVIFKGKNLYTRWTTNNVANATCMASKKGWSEGEIACEWLKTEFKPATRVKAAGAKHILLMDGHSSHFTPEVIEFALSMNIAILGYPPHCTHALQGLDVVCFAKMKNELKKSIADFEDDNQRAIDKKDFLLVFGRAFNLSFTVESVKAAFRATDETYRGDISKGLICAHANKSN